MLTRFARPGNSFNPQKGIEFCYSLPLGIDLGGWSSVPFEVDVRHLVDLLLVPGRFEMTRTGYKSMPS